MEKINCPLKNVINVWTNFSQISLLQLLNKHMVIYNVSYTCSISKISYKHAYSCSAPPKTILISLKTLPMLFVEGSFDSEPMFLPWRFLCLETYLSFLVLASTLL